MTPTYGIFKYHCHQQLFICQDFFLLKYYYIIFSICINKNVSLLYYTYHLEFCFQTSVCTRWLFTKWNLSKLQQRYYFSRLFFIFKQNKRYFYAQVAELLPPSSRLHVARVRHAAHTSSVWVAAGPTMKREPGVCSLSVGRPSAGWKQCCAVSLIKKGIGVSEKSRSACEQSIRAHQAAARTIVSRDSHHAFLVCLPTVSPSSHTSPVLSTPPTAGEWGQVTCAALCEWSGSHRQEELEGCCWLSVHTHGSPTLDVPRYYEIL